jgi:hypothetical protein
MERTVNWDYIAGYFDGEGSVCLHPRSYRIEWANTHLESLEAMRSFMGNVGWIRGQSRGGHRKVYHFLIANLTQLRAVLPELAQRCIIKREALELLGEHIKGRKAVENYGIGQRVDPTDLRRWYIDERLSSIKIAEQLSCSVEAVCTMLRKAQIPIRSRSEAHTIANRAGRWKRRGSPMADLDPADVRRLYVDEGLSIRRVADTYGASELGMRAFMIRHGVPIRTCKEAQQLRRSRSA